ncbi:helix-turn-helix domain-containing protein [Nonomuraea sp. SMC257]|uniref:Helix-turn-helix domain-containing protein n=1 Tax=Nonomuraea montanisoli TaxID=2741721 RepID=A0A7Y6I3C6_9ACTN|nr:helix-turn-helix domain-containing protein [Nonomuraea montanisoli]NUW30960.1 helix-turn-helix domain-containing protein [Nonomuraea montanisoli]
MMSSSERPPGDAAGRPGSRTGPAFAPQQVSGFNLEWAAAFDPKRVERLTGIEAVNARIESTVERAGEVLSTHAVRRPAGDDPAARRRMLDNLGRGIRYRTILHRATLETPGELAYFTELHRAGDHHRVTDQPIQTMVLVDRATAFVPLVPDTPAAGALVIRQPGIVATLVNLFEYTWAASTDLEPAEPYLSESERQALELLGRLRAFLADGFVGRTVTLETAARHVGLSPRRLQQRLREAGTSWRAELERVRDEVATSLLAEHRLPIAAIATRLGYSDARAFRRAFVRRNGIGPHEFREASGSVPF